jgi:hypothetical protein|tara:strand:- start:379 stop:888 length:510 start_codon:yes stop_codon:yes gene_type:complete
MKVRGIFLFALLISATAGCSLLNSNDGLSDKLVGTWEQKAFENTEGNIKGVFEHDFEDIDTYELALAHYDLEDNFLGYRYFETGSYSLKGNKLVRKPAEVFSSENQELYSTIDELKASGVNRGNPDKMEYRTEFSNANTTVTLYFECPPNALCTEPPVLKKVLSGPDIF